MPGLSDDPISHVVPGERLQSSYNSQNPNERANGLTGRGTNLPRVVTRMVVLSEEADIMPGQLLIWAQSSEESLELKETCYGLMIQGEEEAVSRVVGRLRERLPYSIFCKERGFCIGDKTRCRTGKKGGWAGAARPGFHQLERESRLLATLGRALEAVEANEEIKLEGTACQALDEETLRLMVQKILSAE